MVPAGSLGNIRRQGRAVMIEQILGDVRGGRDRGGRCRDAVHKMRHASAQRGECWSVGPSTMVASIYERRASRTTCVASITSRLDRCTAARRASPTSPSRIRSAFAAWADVSRSASGPIP